MTIHQLTVDRNSTECRYCCKSLLSSTTTTPTFYVYNAKPTHTHTHFTVEVRHVKSICGQVTMCDITIGMGVIVHTHANECMHMETYASMRNVHWTRASVWTRAFFVLAFRWMRNHLLSEFPEHNLTSTFQHNRFTVNRTNSFPLTTPTTRRKSNDSPQGACSSVVLYSTSCWAAADDLDSFGERLKL